METEKNHQKTANLALQGGGSHGAFAWGVLDRLLEESRLSIEGITATSAGALNAVALAYGLSVGGREGAKDVLKSFWRRISGIADSQMLRPTVLDKLYGNFGLDNSPCFRWIELLCQISSPYQFNPFDYNPLRNLVEDLVDFDWLRKQLAIKLFLCATNVRTGKLNVFEGGEICVKHVMAACCRPLLTHAVEIDGEYYWDGAFIANPPIFPVIYGCDSLDIILVHLTPIVRQNIPYTPRAILTRMQEISFNSSLMREMRAIAFMNKLIDDGKMPNGKKMLLHMIEAEDVLGELPDSSKMNNGWDFLCHLHNAGFRCANDWLISHFDRLGVESSIDVQMKYL
jgi:NTE family protein